MQINQQKWDSQLKIEKEDIAELKDFYPLLKIMVKT